MSRNGRMTVDRIVLDRAPGVTRVAFLDNDRVVEVWVEGEDRPSLLGAVVLARARTMGGGGTAVLTLPEEQEAYLRAHSSRNGRPRDGETVMVQIARDAVTGKRAVARTAIELSDGGVILTPERPELGLSSAIRGKTRRDALKTALEPLLSDDIGIVIRGTVADVAPEVVTERARVLIARWTALKATAETAQVPAWLIPPLDVVDAARIHAPGVEPEVDTTGLLFESCGALDALDVALAREAPFAGGALVVDWTEAATLIDVNVAQDTRRALREGAVAAARHAAVQARLRGLRGTVLIDVPRLRDKAAQNAVAAALAEAAVDDPTPLRVLGWTPGGMLECVREGARRPLADEMLEPPGPRPNARAAAWAALDRLRREVAGIARPRLVVAPAVEAWLAGPGAAIVASERQRLGALTVVGDAALSRADVRIESEDRWPKCIP